MYNTDIGISLILSANYGSISKISSMVDMSSDENTDFGKLDITLFEAYPVLIPPNWVYLL